VDEIYRFHVNSADFTSYPNFIMASMVEEGSNAELLMSRHSRQAAIKGCSCNYGGVRISFGIGPW
jgi:hypothetical protein